jgi:hypothetical protein
VRPIQVRPGRFVRAGFSLLSTVKAHLAIRVDPGPYGSVRISWAERRQNPSAADPELGTVSDRLGDAAAAR